MRWVINGDRKLMCDMLLSLLQMPERNESYVLLHLIADCEPEGRPARWFLGPNALNSGIWTAPSVTIFLDFLGSWNISADGIVEDGVHSPIRDICLKRTCSTAGEIVKDILMLWCVIISFPSYP